MKMLISTPSGDTYTFSEYQPMFAKAGFVNATLYDVIGSPGQIMIASQ